MLLRSAISATLASVGLALSRRHGVVAVNTAKIQAPLLRQATDLFLSIGDHALAFVEKQGIDVNKYIGPEKKSK